MIYLSNTSSKSRSNAPSITPSDTPLMSNPPSITPLTHSFFDAGNGNGLSGTLSPLAVFFLDVIFRTNIASVSGGALHLANLNCAQLLSTILSGNSALSGDGGAIYLGAVSNFVAINGSLMTLNHAGGRGGNSLFHYTSSCTFSLYSLLNSP